VEERGDEGGVCVILVMSDEIYLNKRIDELREVLNKSIYYRQDAWNKRTEGKWSKLWSSFDTIEDTFIAITEFRVATPINKLSIYGVLQALVVQQDAVRHLEEAIGLKAFKLKDYPDLKRIREIRNETIGHPSETKKDRNALNTNGDITYTSASYKNTDNILEYIIWSAIGTLRKEIDVLDAVNKQEILLSNEFNRIMEEIIKKDEEHIKKFEDDSLSKKIAQAGYYIQKLWPFEKMRDYSMVCFESLESLYKEFKSGIKQRYNIEDFGDYGVQIPGVIDEMIKIDKLLPRIKEMLPMGDKVDVLDLEVYVESLDNSFTKLQRMAIEIDTEFKIKSK
jgi:hypothetical protein